MVFDMIFKTPYMNFDMVSTIQEKNVKHCIQMKGFESIKTNVILYDLRYGI